MPFQGTAPNDTFVRTDGTRTGLTVWQQAEAAGVDIVSIDHDSHDQDVASAINYVYAAHNNREYQVVSQTTAAGSGVASPVFEFTLQTGYHNVFMLDNLTLNTAANIILHLNFMDASGNIINGPADYQVARHGYGGATAGAIGDHDASISAILPFTALGLNIAADQQHRIIAGIIEVYGAQAYATDGYQSMQGTLTVIEGGAMTVSQFVGQLEPKYGISKVRMQISPGAVVSGHITHYRIRKS